MSEDQLSLSVPINNELERRIADAFELFDHAGKQAVDVREIGTIMRSLGCCPSEEEIQEVLLATEEKEATGSVQLANFLPYMCQKITEHRYYPADAETLLAAFNALDEDGKHKIPKDKFTKLIMEEGEPFTQEEYDEMIQVALDTSTDTIHFEHYITQLMPTSTQIYVIADEIEAARPKKVKTALQLMMEAEAEQEANEESIY